MCGLQGQLASTGSIQSLQVRARSVPAQWGGDGRQSTTSTPPEHELLPGAALSDALEPPSPDLQTAFHSGGLVRPFWLEDSAVRTPW